MALTGSKNQAIENRAVTLVKEWPVNRRKKRMVK
jgi:hypothetical protein